MFYHMDYIQTLCQVWEFILFYFFPIFSDAVPQYNHHKNDIDVVHMVLIHRDSSSSIIDGQNFLNCSLHAYLLRSPSELSGQVIDILHLTPRLYLADQELPEPLLPDLPVITGKMLHKIHAQLTKTQFAALKCEIYYSPCEFLALVLTEVSSRLQNSSKYSSWF